MLTTERKFIIYNEIFQKCRQNKNNKIQLRQINNIKIGDIIKAYVIIGNNKNFDKKILEVINQKTLNQLSWYDYLENILNIFTEIHSNLTEIGKSASSGFYTPIWLVDRILDKYPISDFSNPDLKWFDPGNGNGNFLLRLTQRLLNGLKNIPGLEDENEGYKWIVEKMIFACEIEPVYMFNYMMYLDPFCQFNINIYCGCFRNKNFSLLNKDWYLDDDTRILGNPPFKVKSGTPWKYFLNKSLKISNYVNFILPISIIRSNSKSSSNSRKLLQDTENYFDLNQNLDDNCYTDGRIILTITKAVTNPTTNIILKDRILKIDNTKIINRVPEAEDEVFSILSKIEKKSKNNKLDYVCDFVNNSRYTTPKELIKQGILSDKQDNIFKYPVQHTTNKIYYSRDKRNTWGKLKVAFNYSGKFIGKKRDGSTYMFATTNLIGKQIAGIEVNNQEEAEIIIHNYSNRIFEFYNIKEKSSPYNQGTINNLPKLPLKKFSDKDLYDYFEFTSEEIKLIEDTIKR